MADAARRDPTPEELAELREYLPILRALRRLLSTPEVDSAKPVKVLRDREPPAEAYQDVERRRKRRGGDGT